MTLFRTFTLSTMRLMPPRIIALTSVSSNVASKLSRFTELRSVATLTAGLTLRQLSKKNPHVDVIRYEHKNVKWTISHVHHHADALAVGFLDSGLVPGDKVLSWLPLHFSEQHILQFACSKAGLILYHLDPSQAIKDLELGKESLVRALEITKANVLVSEEAGNDVNYVKLVEGVIPEVRIFDIGEGKPFFTPRFPHLRFAIHTGLDYQDKFGMVPLNNMLCPTGDSYSLLAGAKLDGKSPLMGELELGSDGVPTKPGKVLSNEDVVRSEVWPEFSSILRKDYLEVKGVGVVF